MSRARGVLLVADAGPAAGLGHLQRSSVLARALRDRGIETRCLGHAAENVIEREGVEWQPLSGPGLASAATADAAIIDSYTLPGEALAAAAATAPLVVIHDLGEPPAEASLVVAPSDPRPSRPGRLNGLEHALVSARFSGLPGREPEATVEAVLVTTGGGDPGGRAAELAQAARRALPESRVMLLSGPQAAAQAPAGVEPVGPVTDLAELVSRVDLVVCGGGATMVEVCAAGVPAAVAVLAPNQAPIVEALAAAGAIVKLDDGDPEAVLRALGKERGRRAELAIAARAAIDGRGADRVAAAIARLLA